MYMFMKETIIRTSYYVYVYERNYNKNKLLCICL